MAERLISTKFVIVLILILVGSIFINLKLSAEAERKTVEIRRSYGVKVHYKYSRELLSHQKAARGSQAWFVGSMLSLVEQFLLSYPREVINRNLSDIFLLGSLEFFGKAYGGTYIDSAIYIATGGFLDTAIPRC